MANTVVVSIPELFPGPTLTIEHARNDRSVEVTKDELDKRIEDLRRSLEMCDRKFETVMSESTSTAEGNDALHRNNSNGMSLKSQYRPMIATEVDPVQSPELWWDEVVRHCYEWIRQVFLARIHEKAQEILRPISFFSWRPYDGKVAQEAAAYSLVLALEPWSTGSISECNLDHSVCPKGIKEREDDLCCELAAFVSSAQGVMDKLQCESSLRIRTDPSLSELLKTAASAMAILAQLRNSESNLYSVYRQRTRHGAIVAIRAVVLVQEWLEESIIGAIKKIVVLYSEHAEAMRRSFLEPMHRLAEQRERFKDLWRQVKEGYDQFLTQQGIDVRDEASAIAVEAMCNDKDFSIDTVKIMKNYVLQIKKLAYSNIVGGVFTPEGDNPIRQLHLSYEKDKQELETIERELRSKGPCEALQKRQKDLSQSIDGNFKVLKNYSNCPVDEHNRWLGILKQLESDLERATIEWSGVQGRKFRRESLLEEEVKRALEEVMLSAYHTHEVDVARVLSIWNDKQHGIETLRKSDINQAARERYIADDWLSNCDRRLVHYANNYSRFLAEFRASQGMIMGSTEALNRLKEFVSAYNDALKLWKISFNYVNQIGKETEKGLFG